MFNEGKNYLKKLFSLAETFTAPLEIVSI